MLLIQSQMEPLNSISPEVCSLNQIYVLIFPLSEHMLSWLNFR